MESVSLGLVGSNRKEVIVPVQFLWSNARMSTIAFRQVLSPTMGNAE